MFRIYSATSRSPLPKSPIFLQYSRSIHSKKKTSASPSISSCQEETAAGIVAPRSSRRTHKLPPRETTKAVKTKTQIKTKTHKLTAPSLKYLTSKDSPKGDVTRIHIVSEQLCDDVLERMKPSLERHIGCDIIDLNPGAGLWSSRLHDFLQPRTHILMEPDAKLHMPRLQPLLDAEGSTYKLLPKSGILWDNLNEAISNEYLPNQPLLESGDPRLELPNDTLLFVANFGHHPWKSYSGMSLPLLMLHQLMTAVRVHSVFQKYGLVRMLVWMADSDKRVILPRSISDRKKFSVEAEISCQDIFEIAGTNDPGSAFRRDSTADLESSLAVLKKMEQLKIKTPRGRESSLQIEASDQVKKAKQTNRGVVQRSFYAELDQLEADYAAGKFTKFVEDARTGGRESWTPLYKRFYVLKNRRVALEKRGNLMEDLIEKYECIAAARAELSLMNSEDAALQQEALDQRMKDWMDEVGTRNTVERATLWIYMDNRRALRNDPPILFWDRRFAEPLLVQDKEFFPNREMCLLDFHPKSIWPILREDNLANYDNFEYILSSLFLSQTQSVTKGLTALAHGAFEWLVPRCPSLTDPAKGGSADLESMSVRCLTQDMLRELTEAWMKWPFRPDRYELMARTGSGVYDPMNEGEQGSEEYPLR